MADHLDLGKKGEDWAAEWLQAKGYQILHRNYRYGRAEVDIIARKDKLLVFVEVKTRTNLSHGEPEMAVSAQKMIRLKDAAEYFIFSTDWQHDVRFDVIAISMGKDREVLHAEDAFC